MTGGRASTFRVLWELVKYRPGRFSFCLMIWTVVHGSPLFFGILIGRVFDRLAAGQPVAATA